MGGALGKVALVALGATIVAAAIERAENATAAAAEAVFEAITGAAQAASRYISALYRAASSSSAASGAYEEVKRFVSQACDAVKRAAACVSSRVVVLIKRLHGNLAAGFVKRKLEGVNGLVYAGDVDSLVASIVDDITAFSSAPIYPEQQFRRLAHSEKATRAASSTTQIMQLLRLLSYDDVRETPGVKVPAVVKVAINVIVVGAELVFAILHA